MRGRPNFLLPRHELVRQGHLSPRPCDEQTPEAVEAYYRAATVGDLAAIRETQDRSLRYFVVPIERIHRGRIYLEGHGSFFAKSGAFCWQPHGQCSLIIPTEAVQQWCADHPTDPYGHRWTCYSKKPGQSRI